jgi:D-apionolactonase
VTDFAPAPGREWRRGAWSIRLRGDEIAEVRWNDRRVLRSVRAVVRDRDWATAELEILSIDDTTRGLTLAVRSHGLGSDIRGNVVVEADGDELSITLDAVSAVDFETNRTGLVALHPPRVAGAELQVLHSDGTTETSRFPEEIAPHQPVFDIAALGWIDDGLEIGVAFAGDVFEMEDQRNWTDASFKTYSRPLALPFPYPLAAGQRVVQSVVVTVREVAPAASVGDPDRIELRPGGAFPAVSVSASSAPEPAPSVPAVGSELLVELDLATPNWRAALQRAASVGLPLDVRIVLADDDAGALDAAAVALRDVPLARVTAFWPTGPARHVSDAEAVAAVRAALAAAGVDATVVGGSRAHFTELNRERHRLPGDLAGLVFSSTPLYHSLAGDQLIEAVAMQRLTALQAVSYAGGAAVHVGPVMLRARYNDVATGPQPAPTRDDLTEGYGAEFTGLLDERIDTDGVAAWTIASAAAFAVPGVGSVSFFEEWGPRGIRRSDGSERPVAAAVQALAEATGELLWGDSPDGLVWALGATDAAGTTILAANLDRAPRTITVAWGTASVGVHLAPYAWSRVSG